MGFIAELDLQADRSLPGRGLRGPATPFETTTLVQTPDARRGGGGVPQTAQAAATGRPRCWREHDRLPPPGRAGGRDASTVCIDDLADLAARRLGPCPTTQAAGQALVGFEADLPNETWQTDITHWHLAGGKHTEIMNMIDDHSRLFLASQAFTTTKAQDVVDVFHEAADLHGLPSSLLSDNGAVFTATPRKGKVLLQTELERLGITRKNSRPYHPQTCGKIERLHQTLKRYLARQKPAKSLTELQAQLDTFVHYYNNIRPHRARDGRTPLQAYNARNKDSTTPAE